MKRDSTLSLVATLPSGSYAQHPVTDEASVARVFGWLGELLPDAVWVVEVGE